MAQPWDVIVIGSGIGGISTAALLAKVANKKVLVLEKHSERGGLTHVFRRDGASWDVGLHYVGDVGKGSRVRSLFDYMSNGALEWNRMPDEFERFIYPDFEFSVPSNRHRYIERLIERYPEEEAAIRTYFADCIEMSNWHATGTMQNALPWPAGSLMGFSRWWNNKKATQTTKEYLDKNFKSAELKSLLATQWPDYGVPPSESAFVLHAIVVGSFFKGGWFPKHGSSRIARTFETNIEAAGGVIKVCKEVTSIITDTSGTAIGVRAIDLSGERPVEIEYHAPCIVSNVGAYTTYNKLLPTNGSLGRLTEPVRSLVERIGSGTSAVTLYVRLKKPASTLGVEGENYWINRTLEHEDLDAQTKAVLEGKPMRAYMSFPSVKSGDDRFYTAEVLTMVKGEAFSAWEATERNGLRGKDYLELKDRIAHGLLDIAESVKPGFKALVQYSELSTPLSVKEYISSPLGAIYGLKGTPQRYQHWGELSASYIQGLYLTGTDLACLGIAGGLSGGLATASRVLGPMGLMNIMKEVRREAEGGVIKLPTSTVKSRDKQKAVVVSKTALTPVIWKIELELDESFTFVPGQYAFLLVAEFEWRAYSIAGVNGRRLTLLVSSQTGGDGAKFVERIEPGVETEIELPFGTYRLRESGHRKVFVATGTGIVPFLPMFVSMESNGELDSAELYFGCRYARENITTQLPSLPKTTVCVSGEPTAENVFHGRVTKALSDLRFDPERTDFYLCGSPAMILDCQDMLARRGAQHILIEPY